MKKIAICFMAVLATALILSCETTKEVPENYTSAQIIQMGQTAYDSSNYSDAEYYYKTVIERYGTDPVVFVEAKYELGHIYMKTKKYTQARACFNEVLGYYESGIYGTLPGAYKKLSLLELAKIPDEKEKSAE